MGNIIGVMKNKLSIPLCSEFKFQENIKKQDCIFDTPSNFFGNEIEIGKVKLVDKYCWIKRFLPEQKYCDKLIKDQNQIDTLPIVAFVKELATKYETQKLFEIVKNDLNWDNASDLTSEHKIVDQQGEDESPSFQVAETAIHNSQMNKLFHSTTFKCVYARILKLITQHIKHNNKIDSDNDNDGEITIVTKPKRYLASNGSDIASLCVHTDTSIGTIILYLNDVESGGETVFPIMGLEFIPKQGNALFFQTRYMFNNSTEMKIQSSLHGAYPLSGNSKEKYIIQFMIYKDKDDLNKVNRLPMCEMILNANVDNNAHLESIIELVDHPAKFAKNGKRKFDDYENSIKFKQVGDIYIEDRVPTLQFEDYLKLNDKSRPVNVNIDLQNDNCDYKFEFSGDCQELSTNLNPNKKSRKLLGEIGKIIDRPSKKNKKIKKVKKGKKDQKVKKVKKGKVAKLSPIIPEERSKFSLVDLKLNPDPTSLLLQLNNKFLEEKNDDYKIESMQIVKNPKLFYIEQLVSDLECDTFVKYLKHNQNIWKKDYIHTNDGKRIVRNVQYGESVMNEKIVDPNILHLLSNIGKRAMFILFPEKEHHTHNKTNEIYMTVKRFTPKNNLNASNVVIKSQYPRSLAINLNSVPQHYGCKIKISSCTNTNTNNLDNDPNNHIIPIKCGDAIYYDHGCDFNIKFVNDKFDSTEIKGKYGQYTSNVTTTFSKKIKMYSVSTSTGKQLEEELRKYSLALETDLERYSLEFATPMSSNI